MKTKIALCAAALTLGVFLPLSAWNNGLALTPTMGWNSYYQFGNNINQLLIKTIADAMDTSGLRAAGYDCVVIDDAWMASSRDASGNLVADPAKFPAGIKILADYLHSKGFKLGIYEDRGTSTCYGLPGSYGHEMQDAKTFASWGVDFVKIDNCGAVGDLQTVYTAWHNAIAASGRPMVYNICAWGFPGSWVTGAAHSWRTTGDSWDGWDRIITLTDINAGLASYAGPGHWNDPDILQVGRGGMTWDQYRAHFSLWAIMAAPLVASGDLRKMSAQTRAILLNAEVIAVDQDSLGVQGTKVRTSGSQEVWSKPLKDGAKAVLLFNRANSPASVQVSWSEIGLAGDSAYVRDLWNHSGKGRFYKNYSATVPATGVVMLKVAAKPIALPVEKLPSRSPFTLFPNPARTQALARIEFPFDIRTASFSAYDLQGRLLKTFPSPAIDVSSFPSGVYILKSKVGHREMSARFVVQK